MVNIQKLLSVATLSTLILSLNSMEFNNAPRLDSLCSVIYLDSIKDKDIDEIFNALKDMLERGCYITVATYLLKQPDETEPTIQKRLAIAYCLALYFQALKAIDEDASIMQFIPQLIIDMIYHHPYLNWNKTKSPYTLALTDETIKSFIRENSLEEQHELLLASMYPKDATLLEHFLQTEQSELLPTLFESCNWKVDLSICDKDGKSVIQRWCDDPDMLNWYNITTKIFLQLCMYHPKLADQRYLLLEPQNGVLHCTAHWGDLELTDRLLELNADPNTPYEWHEFPLHAAINKPAGVPIKTMRSMCKKLLKAKADPNLLDSNGRTSLHYAALNSFDRVTTLLLQAKAHPFIKDSDGNTPLHYAVDRSSPYCVETEEDDDVERRITDTIKSLLKYNADPEIKNNNNERALDIAIEETSENFRLLVTACKRGTKRKFPS